MAVQRQIETYQQSLASWLAWHSSFAVSRYYDDFERTVL
jgi:hypothetical protein